MIFKEVGQTMDLLLVKVAEEHHIDAGFFDTHGLSPPGEFSLQPRHQYDVLQQL